jgi:hypothetical protein
MDLTQWMEVFLGRHHWITVWMVIRPLVTVAQPRRRIFLEQVIRQPQLQPRRQRLQPLLYQQVAPQVAWPCL